MAITPPRVVLLVRPLDPTPVWVLLRICIIATMALAIIGAASDFFELTVPEASQLGLATRIWYLAYVYSSYANWIVFILTLILLMWLTYRLARNLHALTPRSFSLSPTFAVGYYLVPIANIFMPPRVTGLIARSTFGSATETTNVNSAIGWWWGTFLLSALLANVAALVASDAGAYDPDLAFDPTAYAASLWISASAWIATLIASVFMLRVFSPLARTQARLVREWTPQAKAVS